MPFDTSQGGNWNDTPDAALVAQKNGYVNPVKNPDGSVTWTNSQGGTVTVGANGVVAGRSGAQGDGASFHPLKELGNALRGATDDLGITTPKPPDLSKTSEFNRLNQTADTFAGDYDTAKTNADQTRGIDLDTIAQLQAAAAGKVPSAAEQMFRKSADQNARQAMGLAASIGGNNPGMALRAGLDAFQDAGARTAADTAALRAKELESARALLATSTSAAAGRDATTAGVRGSQVIQSASAPFSAKTGSQQQQINADAGNQAALGTLYNTFGQALVRSDETTKSGIAPAPAQADNFLDSLNPSTFHYDNPGPMAPPGQRIGVMAQDLPKHDVTTGPDGKKYISASVISDILAGLGRVNERQKAIEGTVAGGSPEYAAAMDYMTAPRVDAHTMARVREGRAPEPRMAAPPDEQMVPMSAVRAMLGMVGR